jgi:hypothetical protein
MPSTYTTNNGIELIGTGEQSGTWGETTNTNFGLIDTALDGQLTKTLASAGTSGSPNTLIIEDGTTSDGRNRLVIFNDGSDLGGTAYVQLTPDNAEKIMFVRNSLSGNRSIIFFQGTYNASNDFELPNGTDAIIKFDGAGTGAVVEAVFKKLYLQDLTATTVDTTNIEVTNIKAKDGTASAIIADSTGVMTVASSVLTTTDINGGTIDGTVIGGSTPAAISGTTITGTSFVTTGDMTFGDNDKAIFGASSDLQIYHDGSNSIIWENGAGDLILRGTNMDVQDSGGYSFIKLTGGGTPGAGVVELKYNNATKLATTSTGIDVTGTVTADGLTVDGAATITDTGNVVGSNAPLLIKSNNGVATTSYGWDNLTSNYDYAFKTNGSERMRIDSSGNVGIGTSSPTADLSVGSATSSSGDVHLRTTKTTFELTPSNSDAGGMDFNVGFVAGGQGPLKFSIGGTESMRIDSSGNVGFGGVTSPQAGFGVSGCIDTNGAYFARGQIAAHQTNAAVLQYGVNLAELRSYGATAGSGQMRFMTGGGGGLSDTEAMRIDASGNLLVGTTSGSSPITLQTRSGEFYQTGMQINSTNSDFSGALLDMRATSGSVNTANGRFLRFYSDNGSTERFHVKGSGEIYTAAGILLGGTGSANLLDDYEEGTWTPAVQGDSSAGTTTYSVTGQKGGYTKIGNSVSLTFYISWTAMTGTGGLLITGMPFTLSGNTSNDVSAGNCMTSDLDIPDGTNNLTLVGTDGDTYLRIFSSIDASGIQQVQCDAGGAVVWGQFTYRTT